MQLSTKHLLGIRDLQASDIQTILDTATQFYKGRLKKSPLFGT